MHSNLPAGWVEAVDLNTGDPYWHREFATAFLSLPSVVSRLLSSRPFCRCAATVQLVALHCQAFE